MLGNWVSVVLVIRYFASSAKYAVLVGRLSLCFCVGLFWEDENGHLRP